MKWFLLTLIFNLGCSQNTDSYEIKRKFMVEDQIKRRGVKDEGVFTIEIIPELAENAEKVLMELGYENITVRTGDGYKGWPEEAPFDRIMVTAAPNEIPEKLVEQLAPNGRMILPVGGSIFAQYLWLVQKDNEGIVTKEKILAVRFVPMVKE